MRIKREYGEYRVNDIGHGETCGKFERGRERFGRGGGRFGRGGVRSVRGGCIDSRLGRRYEESHEYEGRFGRGGGRFGRGGIRSGRGGCLDSSLGRRFEEGHEYRGRRGCTSCVCKTMGERNIKRGVGSCRRGDGNRSQNYNFNERGYQDSDKNNARQSYKRHDITGYNNKNRHGYGETIRHKSYKNGKRKEGGPKSTSKVIGCLVAKYSKIEEKYNMLKSYILTQKKYPDNYIDFDKMAHEMDGIGLNAEATFEATENAFHGAKRKIRKSEDPSLHYTAMTKFASLAESSSQDIDLSLQKLHQIQEKFKASPTAHFARLTKEVAEEVKTIGNLKILKLPIIQAYEDETKKIRRFQMGEGDLAKPNKTILMMGMTGSGKSMLVNNIINYLSGINYGDNFRYQMIMDNEDREEHASKANSMTSWVTAYDLNYQEGFGVNYQITIIDTPGFGDTRGIKFDEAIVDQIRYFFDDEKAFPSQEINCVGFVIQASQARITEETKYVFDQVMNIFGKDIADKIMIFFTFADTQSPPALEAIKEHKIPFAQDCTFKFNNCSLYSDNSDKFSELFWKFGYENLEKFFLVLGGKEPINLKLTKEVLQERDHLKCILGGLKDKIDQGMEKLKAIESMIDQILNLEGTLKQNQGFTITKSVQEQSTRLIKNFITNCKICMFTCHNPCGIRGDDKQQCSSMKNGICKLCPGKCSWDVHQNGDRIYVYTTKVVEETIGDMCEKYEVAVSDKDAKSSLLHKMLSDYKKDKGNIFEDLIKATVAASRLEKIAIKNTFLTNVTYIERLIKSEELSNRPNKQHRIDQLSDFLKKAKILEYAKINPGKFTEYQNEYEITVSEKLKKIENENIGFNDDLAQGEEVDLDEGDSEEEEEDSEEEEGKDQEGDQEVMDEEERMEH